MASYLLKIDTAPKWPLSRHPQRSLDSTKANFVTTTVLLIIICGLSPLIVIIIISWWEGSSVCLISWSVRGRFLISLCNILTCLIIWIGTFGLVIDRPLPSLTPHKGLPPPPRNWVGGGWLMGDFNEYLLPSSLVAAAASQKSKLKFCPAGMWEGRDTSCRRCHVAAWKKNSIPTLRHVAAAGILFLPDEKTKLMVFQSKIILICFSIIQISS